MSCATPPISTGRSQRSKESIRRRECRLTDHGDAIPIPPSALPPTPPSPPPTGNRSLLTPSIKESSKFSAGSTAFRSKLLSSTPFPPNRVVRKSAPSRRASPCPLLIPSELTLSIVRESPLTAIEELTCGDHVDGKEDSVSSTTRPAEESAAITERQCVAYGTPRETSVAAAAATATAATAATAGVTTVEEIPESTQHTMGACTSKKSSSSSVKKSEKSPPTTKPEVAPKHTHTENDEVNDEEDPATLPKFKLKRDSIAVTKVRLLKTQIHQETTIGEEEEDDDEEQEDSHVHFDNHVSKQSIPNDSGVSLNSCPDNDPENVNNESLEESDQDYSSIRFDKKLDCDAVNEISLASNVTLRSLRKERIAEDESQGVQFKSIRERTKQLFGNQMNPAA